MGRAKDITMRVIPTKVATPFMKTHHYSGKVVNNSLLHFGVFLDGQLHGVMSYGPSLDKSKIIGLVAGTGWNEFLELNRMAFDSYLPEKLILVSDILADLAVLALGVVLAIYGIRFCNSPLSVRGKYASLPKLSKFWQYLPIPVAGAGMIIFELEQVFRHTEALILGKQEEKEATQQ